MIRNKWLVLVTLILMVVGGYSYLSNHQVVSGHIEFTRQGATILLDLPQKIEKITIKNEAGQLVSVVTVGPGARQKIPVFIKWEADRQYVVELHLLDGHSARLTARSPAEASQKVSLVLQAPYGLNNSGSIGVVPVGIPFTANLLLTNHTEQPIIMELDLQVPSGIEIITVPQGMRMEQRGDSQHLVGQRRVSAKNENWNEQIQLKAVQVGIKSVLQVLVTLDNGQEQWKLSEKATVQVASVADISSKIHIQAVELPVDLMGRFDPKARSGNLVYTPPSRLTHIMGGQTDSARLDDEAFAYASVQLSNDGDEQVLMLISGKVIDPATGALSSTFLSPPHKNAGLGYSYGVAAIAPHATSQVILPIYLNENSAFGGRYQLRTEVSVFGVNQVITSMEKEITLVTRNDRPIIITLFMVVTALIGISWLLWKQEAALACFTTKDLVIISLFGTVTFVTVNLPQTVLWDLAHVILGPFSFLFTGFFSQTVLYALIVALALILRRPGVVTLMIVVRFILSGFIFGHFTPLQILNCTILSLCLEVALYIAGVTRTSKIDMRKNMIIIAVICGLVDVITTYMNFMSYMTLYRLFYADWYIYANLLVGFSYTAGGAVLGCRLGKTLKRTAMD